MTADPVGSSAVCRSKPAHSAERLGGAAIAAFVICLPFAAVAGKDCGYPMPSGQITVAAYLKQLDAMPKGGLGNELGSAINDLVEWTPASCGDVPPETSYKSFLIRSVLVEGEQCRSFHIGIVPSGAATAREETPVSCSPAKDGSANGWICFFH